MIRSRPPAGRRSCDDSPEAAAVGGVGEGGGERRGGEEVQERRGNQYDMMKMWKRRRTPLFSDRPLNFKPLVRCGKDISWGGCGPFHFTGHVLFSYWRQLKKKKRMWVEGVVASSKFAERWRAQNLNNLLV